VLPIKAFQDMMEELEAFEDIKPYDEAQKEDNGERILFSDYLKSRKTKNSEAYS
jgi:hypothetical protein